MRRRREKSRLWACIQEDFAIEMRRRREKNRDFGLLYGEISLLKCAVGAKKIAILGFYTMRFRYEMRRRREKIVIWDLYTRGFRY